MQRHGCFEVRTNCPSCGQSFPVNGPYRKFTCTACFEDMTISQDVLADFLNDFEEEYEGLVEGQGRGGTLICGSGTFKYSYWRLKPRCSECKKPLSIPEFPEISILSCSECAATHHVFAVPDWLGKQVPSARYCCTPQPPPGDADEKDVEVDEASAKPVVMSCPKCAGTLTVSARSERIMECVYCSTEVYVPDAVWKRLHPVRITEEWFVLFEGRNRNQLQAERRIRDIEEEKTELKKWNVINAPGKVKSKLRPLFTAFGIFLSLVIALTLVLFLMGYDQQDVSEILSGLSPIALVVLAVLVPVGFALRTAFSSKIGRGKECKQAMALLAEKHRWKHEAAECKSTLGYINAKFRGRDIEIDPSDDYAIEVDIDDSPFYLKTEPPGYPHDGVQRFTTGDSRFDNLFPIRYAIPELAERIEKSVDEARLVLAPLYRFLDRWQKKLGRLKVDWSAVGVHLSPGHVDMMDSGNMYLLAEDLEPLLEDITVLAKEIDFIASGRDPELP
jgi:hypothetical protein